MNSTTTHRYAVGAGNNGGLLQDQAYASLKDSIIAGHYPPGMFLSERRLVDDLQMSKTPIRAALERLEARNSKDWARADKLRDAIAELGYSVQDTPQGPVLIPKKGD